MKITKISFSLGCTVNLGNYENLRPEITVEAEIGQYKSVEGEMDSLQQLAKRELALSLWDRAEADLRPRTRLLEIDEGDRIGWAVGYSAEFRWIHDLNPKVAADLLAGIMEEQRAEAELEAAKEAEAKARLAQSLDEPETEAAEVSGDPEAEAGTGEQDVDQVEKEHLTSPDYGSDEETAEPDGAAEYPEEWIPNQGGN